MKPRREKTKEGKAREKRETKKIQEGRKCAQWCSLEENLKLSRTRLKGNNSASSA